MYYDWKNDSEAVQKEGVHRDILSDTESGQSAGIQYVFHFHDPVYSHALSTTQIEALSLSNAGAEHYHVSGLTQAGYSANTHYQVNWSKKWFKNEYQMWVDNLRVEFTYDTLNVYVTSAYPEGSCEYQATLAHENQHVAVHRQIYEQYQKVFQDRVGQSKDIPLASHPVVVGSIEEGKKKIGEIISADIDPTFDQFKDALQAEQDKLDTQENYAALHQQCNHW